MKVTYVRSMGLPKGKGIPVNEFSTQDEIVAHLKGDSSKVVDIINLYGRQKTALVDGRLWLSDEVDKAGFKRLKKDGSIPTEDTEFSELETDSDHLDRFAEAVTLGAAGKKKGDPRSPVVSFPGFTVPATATKDDDKVTAAWAFLQTMLDKHGPFDIDLNAAPRTGGFKKKLPDWAFNGARNIIANNAQAKWVKNFTEGYTDAKKDQHSPVAFQPFTTVAPKGASQTGIDAVAKANFENLARAIYTDVQQQEAKMASAYA